jgi:hypothetical protein
MKKNHVDIARSYEKKNTKDIKKASQLATHISIFMGCVSGSLFFFLILLLQFFGGTVVRAS